MTTTIRLPKMPYALMCAFSFALALGGCGLNPQNDKAGTVQPPAPKPSPKDDVTKSYVQTGTLNLITTNQELAAVKNNWLAIDGFGTKSTYKFQYSFNSGANDTFKLLSLERKTTGKACRSIPETTATLSSKYGIAALDLLTKASLIPDTDYVLELSVGATGCLDVDVRQNVIAWAVAGGKASQPRLANLCKGRLAEAAFLPNYNTMTVFLAGQKVPFINPQNYCGNSIDSFQKIQCVASGPGFPGDSTVSCQAQTDSAAYTFEVQSLAQSATAKITCTKNGSKIATEEFKSCRPMVLDLGQFEQFEP